jgi:hypothetical protein
VLTPPLDSWNWLRELDSEKASCYRVVLYEWDTDPSCVYDVSPKQALHTMTLRAFDDFQLLRGTSTERQRPLAFIGHGLGGLIIKYALILCSNNVAVAPWLHALYRATCAVFFASTPHFGFSKTASRIRESSDAGVCLFMDESGYRGPGHGETDFFNELHQQFRSLSKDMEVHYLWERQPTSNKDGDMSAFIVEKDSAAPDQDRHYAEIISIEAPHRDILAFNSRAPSGHEVVLYALKVYVRRAFMLKQPDERPRSVNDDGKISSKTDATIYKANSVSGYARAHFGDSFTTINLPSGSRASDYPELQDRLSDLERHRDFGKNTNFVRKCLPDFTGRQQQLERLKYYLGDPKSRNPEGGSRVVIVHGTGGAGKTELCLKFADQAQNMSLAHPRLLCVWLTNYTGIGASSG